MSVCGLPEEESASEEPGAPLREAYEQKSASKVVRVLTVLAYLLSVSLAAILLSVYYVCVWKSPELPKLNGTGESEVAAQRGDQPFPTRPNATEAPFHNADGRGSIAVDETASTTEPTNIASETTDSSSASPELPLLATVSFSLPDNRTGSVGADNSSVT